MKSSAVSVSRPCDPAGRESAPSLPSGLPVLKEKLSAQAGIAKQTARAKASAVRPTRILIVLLCWRGFLARTQAMFRPTGYQNDLAAAGSDEQKEAHDL